MRIYQTGFFLLLFLVLSSFTSSMRPKKKSDKKTTTLERIAAPVLYETAIAADTVAMTPLQLPETGVAEEDTEMITASTQASYYHDRFTGRRTASGVVFDNDKYTAAHSTLPFGTKVKVTNLKNKKSVILTITDRGPFSKNRGIDITKKAFMEIAQHKGSGVLNVKIEKIDGDI
ncbi:septal ring lytic transglycosylase RlpA family protein [Flavobacterium sp. JP2137]|uniref:septal ring lytic transglycosylase RlpA family protein n=1 Tax=Flavobacterium sp. JP2137 TaxID=3414510 RepID=UPI003D2FF565